METESAIAQTYAARLLASAQAYPSSVRSGSSSVRSEMM